MKRLVIFVLSLMLASLAPAAVLELSIDGVTNGVGTGQAITLAPSDYRMIDVYCSASPDFDDWFMTITGPGSLAGMGTIYSAPAPAAGMSVSYYQGVNWLKFTTTGAIEPTPAIGKWWDEQFHCDGAGLVTITLWNQLGTIVEDTITVTQAIPEPVTVSLLGLGGLLLRRRVKK